MGVTDILIILLKRGAYKRRIRFTTTELGEAANMSQQNASRMLIELEKDSYITREGCKIKLNKKGVQLLAKLYAELEGAFSKGKIKVNGKIVKGFGEGRYYLSQEEYIKQIEKTLGFRPFAGTLNVKLDEGELGKRELITEKESKTIKGFVKKGRKFGELYVYPCKINGIGGGIVIPLRTHHGYNILEIVAPINLKRKFGWRFGDNITIEF